MKHLEKYLEEAKKIREKAFEGSDANVCNIASLIENFIAQEILDQMELKQFQERLSNRIQQAKEFDFIDDEMFLALEQLLS